MRTMGKRWIQPPKLLAVAAAVSIGLFLSVSSHAFGWSEGATFAVACALVALLALLGPALFLREAVEEGGAEPQLVLAREGVQLHGPPDQVAPATNPYFSRVYFGKGSNPHFPNTGTDYRFPVHLNRAGDYHWGAGAWSGTTSRELTPTDFELDFGQFVALMGRPETVAGAVNVGGFDSPREAALAGRDD